MNYGGGGTSVVDIWSNPNGNPARAYVCETEVAKTAQECPTDGPGAWVEYRDVTGVEGHDSCLLFVDQLLTYSDAQAVCTARHPNAHLVTTALASRPSASSHDIVATALRMAPQSRQYTFDGGIWLGASTPTPGTTPTVRLKLEAVPVPVLR
jgi:hypothetical protein